MQKSLRSFFSENRTRIQQGIAIWALAFLLRVIGIGWGLPNDLHHQSYHPDELVIEQYSQLIEPGKLKFDPGFYNYGTLYLTVLRVASDVTAAYTGGVKESDPDSKWQFTGRVHLAGRLISAATGAGTAVLVFFMLLPIASTIGAFAGAGLIAFAPGFVVHSRFQTVDVLATFLFAASTLYALRIIRDRGESGDGPSLLKTAILAGVFAGLSAGTKYTGILALLSLLVAIGISKGPGKSKLAGAGVGSALVAFLLSTPGALLNSSKFLEDFRYEMQHTSTGHGLLFEGVSSGFVYHFANLVAGIGLIAVSISLSGLIVGAVRKLAWVWVLLAFWLPYYLLIGRAEVLFLRYTFPLYIGLAVGFGYVVSVGQAMGGKGRLVVAAAILGLGGFDLGGLRKTAVLTATMASTDARDAAALDLRQYGEGKTVGVAKDPWFYTPPTFPESGLTRGPDVILEDGRTVIGGLHRMFISMERLSRPKTMRYLPPELALDRPWTAEALVKKQDWDLRLITESKPDFIAVSNYELNDEMRLWDRTDVSEAAQSLAKASKTFSNALGAEYELFRSYGAQMDTVPDLMYVSPYVQIWKRKAKG